MSEVVHYMEKCSALSARVAELEAELVAAETRLQKGATARKAAEAELAKVKTQWTLAAKAQLERSEKAEAEVERLERMWQLQEDRALGAERGKAKAEVELAGVLHQLSLEEQQHKDENDRLRAKLAEAQEDLDSCREVREELEAQLAEVEEQLRIERERK